MKKYKNVKMELLRDFEVKKEYENLGAEFLLIEEVIKRRNKKGITQRDLAQKIGTKQSAISRFESGSYNPSISFLKKLADGLDANLNISLITKK
ncbi:MAG: helix-turn-helix transcriptional regulator [bacterium]|nr:helix-turn-helix transcriptional regulator [bacterium]